MDLSMPGMDGWEATRRLKADRRTQAHSDHRADRARADWRSRQSAKTPDVTRSSPSPACRTPSSARCDAPARRCPERGRDRREDPRMPKPSRVCAASLAREQRSARPHAERRRRGRAAAACHAAVNRRARTRRAPSRWRDSRRHGAGMYAASSRSNKPLQFGLEHHRRRGRRRPHRQLQGSRGRRVGRAHRPARLDARERAGARARQRDGHAAITR